MGALESTEWDDDLLSDLLGDRATVDAIKQGTLPERDTRSPAEATLRAWLSDRQNSLLYRR